MARAPFQVLVYPFRISSIGHFEYCLFQRSDNGIWQGIAGGGEGDETPIEAAKRESFEEATLPTDLSYRRLDTIESIPVTLFNENWIWGEDVYVIPQYTFAVEISVTPIVISHEHTQFRWFNYDQAYASIKYDGDKTALWELNQRLKGKGPRN